MAEEQNSRLRDDDIESIALHGIKKTRVVFTHIPKCAGTTIYSTLSPLFESSITSHDLSDPNRDGSDKAFVATHIPFHDLEIDPVNDWLLTSFRDPAARVRSLYRFWRSTKLEAVARSSGLGETYEAVKLAHALPFNEFVKRKDSVLLPHIDNAMVRHFVKATSTVDESHCQEAMKIIEKFDAFIFVETMKADLQRIFNMLGRNSIANIVKRNQTDELHQIYPNEYRQLEDSPRDEMEIGAEDSLNDIIKHDSMLYSNALAVQQKLLKKHRNSEKNYYVAVPGMRISDVVPNISYAFQNGKSRDLLWGNWSGSEDICAWTTGNMTSIRFRVARAALANFAPPILTLSIRAYLPRARHLNSADIGLAGQLPIRIIFLNPGRSVDLREFDSAPKVERTIVISDDHCKVSLPLTGNDHSSEEPSSQLHAREKWAYFTVELSNLADVPGILFGEKEERKLGVQIENLEIEEGGYPFIT